MRKYWHCLAQRYSTSLLTSNFLGRLPNGMGALAIVLFLRAHGVAFGQVGAVTGLFALCSAIGGPMLARVVDKRGQRATLLVAACGSGAGFIGLAWFGAANFTISLAGVAIAGLFMPPLEPALRSMWPSVLPDEPTVAVAYALDSALQNVVFVAGPLLVVSLVAITSTALALVTTGLIGILGTVIFVLIPPVRMWRGERRAHDWAGALRSPLLLVILAGMLFVGAMVGVFNVATVAYAEQARLPGFAGLLLGAFSLGSMVGGLAYGARKWTGDPLKRLLVLLLVLAAATWPLISVAGPSTMIALMALAGLGLAPILTCCFVLIGTIAPRGTITEAFAWLAALFLSGSAAGSALAGAVLPAANVMATFALAGLASTAAFAVVALAVSLFASGRRTASADLSSHAR